MIRVVDLSEKPVSTPANPVRGTFKLCPCGRVCFVAEDGQPFDVGHFAPYCDAVKLADSRASFAALCSSPLTGQKG